MTMVYTFAISSAVVLLAGTNPLNTFLATWLAVEVAAFGISKIGMRNGVIAAGMVLGADVYADTVLLKAQAFIKDENNKKFQLRPELTTAINAFKKDREYTIPNLAAIRNATTQATEALYMKQKDFTINTSKSCSPSGETSGSGAVSVTFVQKQFVISSNYKQYAGNQVTMDMALANDLYNGENSLWTAVDQYLIDYLETNKSGVNNAEASMFDSVNDIQAIDDSNELFFYNIVRAQMATNNYSGNFSDVADTMWQAKRLQYINQGAGNSTNSSFQFGGFDFYPSNLISAGTIGATVYTSIHYIIPDGAVAILDWNDPLNRAGQTSGESSWYTMQSMVHPEFTFDVYKTTACADTSSSGGSVQDLTTTWEFTLNFAVAKQPVPTALETPIYKYGVTASFTS